MTDSTTLPPVRDPMIIDLFAGPGGLDVGAHWLGVPSIGIEVEDSAVRTRIKAGLNTIRGDVEKWQPTNFDQRFNVLTGGPPCQTFTVAGRGKGRLALDRVIALVERLNDISEINAVVRELSPETDRRTGLVLQPLIWALRALEAGQPYEAIMLEQVPTVAPVWEAMARVLESHGYGATTAILRTEEFGVPQTRRRAVLMARKAVPSKQIAFPAATNQKYIATHIDADIAEDKESQLPLWTSMEEALSIETPFQVVSNYGSGGDPRNRSRRRGNRPAFTVTGKVTRNKIVPDRGSTRGITPAEAGILQTFPENYPWEGKDLSQQIGNAIPPRLAAHVLNSLLGLEMDIGQAAANGRAWRENSQPKHHVERIAAGIRNTPRNFGDSDEAILFPYGVTSGQPENHINRIRSRSRGRLRLAPLATPHGR